MATRRSTRLDFKLLGEISDATEELNEIRYRRNIAIKTAFEEGVDRDDIGAAAGITRSAVYKLMEDKPWLREEVPE
jgi:hypothetical protein